MVTKLKASLGDDGKIADWNFEVWSNTHSMRPGGAGCLLAAQHMAQPFAVPAAKPLPLPEGGGDRNAIPIYAFPNAHVVHHFLPDMPIRISAMRALGAYHNVFSIESFMDELADLAGADPVEFRLKHLDDPRGRDVIAKAAEGFGWKKGQKATAGPWLRLCLRALQESRGLLRDSERSRGQSRDRPRAAGAGGRCRGQRAGGQSGRADQPDRGRDRAVDELDAVRSV